MIVQVLGMKYQSIESEFSKGAQIICCTNFDPRAHRIPATESRTGGTTQYVFVSSIHLYFGEPAGSVGRPPIYRTSQVLWD